MILQRIYKTESKQILIDIKEAINNPNKELYLLDFIYYLDEGKYMIADGQQRLVSINSLHKVINDVINERNLDIEPLELYNIEYDIDQNNKKYNDSFYNSLNPLPIVQNCCCKNLHSLHEFQTPLAV